MTMIGAGLLWFGWFGFNAGSALAGSGSWRRGVHDHPPPRPRRALGWLWSSGRHRGKPTVLGVASGLVAGLVAITPASGYVAPMGRDPDRARRRRGLLRRGRCSRTRFGYDDSLDAFGVHGVGGLAGALLTGVFAQKLLNDAGADGALFGNLRQLGVQALACAATGAYSAIATYAILKLIGATLGLRVTESEEREGLDATQHGEEAYGGGGATPYEPKDASRGA